MNFKEMCRTCLRSGEMMSSLFDEEVESAKLTAADLLAMFTFVQINKKDDFPHNICDTCLKEIQQAYFFNLKCEKSEIILHQLKGVRVNLRKLKEIPNQNETDSESTCEFQSNTKENLGEIINVSENNVIIENNAREIVQSVEAPDFHDNDFQAVRKKEPNHNNPTMKVNTNEKELERIEILSNFLIVKEECDPEFEVNTNPEPDCNNRIIGNNSSQKELELNQTPFGIVEECDPEFQMTFKTEPDHNNRIIKDDQNEEEIEFNEISSKFQIVEKDCVPGFHMTFKTEPELDIGINCNDVQLKCLACLKHFQSLDMFRGHIVSDHLEENICKLCDEEFDCSQFEHSAKHLPVNPSGSSKALIRQTEKVQNTVKFCQYCSMHFEDLKMLRLHVTVEHSRLKFKCSVCQQILADRSDYDEHMKTEHNAHIEQTTDDQAKCDEINDLHAGKKQYACWICPNESFEFKKELSQHNRKYHFVYGVKCRVCFITLPSQKELLSHMKIVHNCEKPFECDLCGALYQQNHGLNLHLRAVHTQEISAINALKCEICSKILPCKAKYLEHVKSHKEKMPFQCALCKKKFRHSETLKGHMRTTHKDEFFGQPDFKCKICSKVFGLRYRLVNHMRTHTGEKPFQCELCPEKFGNSRSLLCHRRTKHTEALIGNDKSVPDYQCSICYKVFGLKFRLRNHMRIHTGEKPFQCELCPEKFQRSESLKTHVYVKHNTNELTAKPDYKCSVCSKVFVFKHSLNSHMRLHTGEKPFQCKLCPVKFRNFRPLDRHIRKKHSKVKPVFQCADCSAFFTSKHNLQSHTRIHTGEKPFQCEFCLQKYISNRSLKSHMQTKHPNNLTGEPDYKCAICSKVFGFKQNLIVHVRTHTGEKPYRCEICLKSLRSKISLAEHMQSKHNADIVRKVEEFSNETKQVCAISNSPSN